MMLHLKRNQLLDTLRGEKGGSGSQHTPVEAADSLRSTSYATILDLVSEGEIEGFALGADKIGQCIALDGTLLENPDGSRNFSNVAVDSRSGTQDQDYIAGVPDVENSIAVGVQLKAAVPWVTRISNTSLSAVRLILSVPNGLQKSDQATGDITGYSVAYKIELSVDDGAYATVLNGAFSGKASGKYQRAHRIDLPAATDHWNLRVTRLTADGNSALIADRTDIDAEVDIVDVKMRYPNSALVSVSVDASQFSSIPTRAYFLKGRRVRIPSNYDPVARTYTGVWDGTFKPGYTDNPAWCFLDMATHSRYGLGKFLTDAQVDKWALYNIAQYCDQLVDDGNGGQEPRFTCGLYLQQKADAFKVMQDMATMFRGISYYTGNAIQAVADMPSDASFIYDNTNVIGGKFTYAGSSLSSRQTVALVSWNDLTDFGKAKVEYVEDQEGIARYGVRTTEVTAIGETRRGGAHRAGRHILFTNRMETETVTFSVGLDGDLAAPGQIIKIVDHDRAGKRQGGRVKSATTTVVTVDQAPDAVVGDTLSVNMPDGVIQTRTISAVDGAAITVGTEFTEAPQAEAVWTVEKTTLAAQTFRVISVKENNADDDMAGFSLSCIQYAPEKFAAIDTGLILQPRPITSLAAPTQDPVASISITYHIVYRQGTAVTVMRIEWVKPAGAVRYAVEWRRGDGTWVSAGASISETAVEVEGVYAGVYQARITAYNVNGVPSVPVVSSAVQIDGKNVAPPAPTLHAVGGLFEIDLSWDFPTSSNVSDTSYTEIQSDTSSGMTTAVQVGMYAYPLNVAVITGLTESETKWVRARLVDKTGNIGDWSVPVSATTSTTDNLFQPIQDQIDSVQTEADSTLAQVQTLQGQVGDILKADVWDVSKTYPLGDLVQKDGSLYRSLIDNNVGNDPATATADWEKIGNYSSLGEAVSATAANVATLQNTVSQQGDDITANSQSISQNTAAIGTKADASALQTTNATVTQHGDDIAATAADVALLGAHSTDKTAFNLNSNTVKVDGGSTLSQTLTSLQTATSDVDSRVDTEEQARIDGDSANATAINSVSIRMPPGTGTVATQASVDAVSGKVNASYTLSLDANGRVVGYVFQNNGTTGSIVFRADVFSIVSPTESGARTEYSNNSWKVYDSAGTLRVQMGVLP